MTGEMYFEAVPLAELSAKALTPDRDPIKPVVLVVDDETIIADSLTAILNRNDIAAIVAYDGRMALEIARLIPPDLLLTDVVMPGMGGIELAIAVEQAVPDCKILLFSGQASTLDLLASERYAGHNFAMITKPVHPKQLLAHIFEGLQSDPVIPRPHLHETIAQSSLVSTRESSW